MTFETNVISCNFSYLKLELNEFEEYYITAVTFEYLRELNNCIVKVEY